MSKGVINIRVENNLKKQCEKIFNELGLGITAGITIYLKSVARNKSIPFSLSLEQPNAETIRALKEVEDIKKGKIITKTYKSAKDLRKDLKI